MIKALLYFLTLCSLFIACSPNHRSVSDVVDNVVTFLYAEKTDAELAALTQEDILALLSETDKKILSTRYWTFRTNVPSTVSIMRHIDQKVVPFWLRPAGFKKTAYVVKNSEYTYEVWQKQFETGLVELGINGFDKHRPHYFVAIAPQDSAKDLILADFYPENQFVSTMEVGAFTYHDWDELVIVDLPERLKGHKLLTTIRGRAREAHLVNAFRNTPFPSSQLPDQILLTWAGDPRTTQSIQWRTSMAVCDGAVEFWQDGRYIKRRKASMKVMEDRLLKNDRYIYRYTAQLSGLLPGTSYTYRVGSPSQNTWSEKAEFITAPDSGAFSFISFGDTHRSPHWGKLLDAAFQRHPDAAFFTIAGDIVSTGLYRDDWDQLFEYSRNVIRSRPFLPSLGNHDDQDGLGAWMFFDLFDLPHNGPEKLEPERAYAVEYANALFLVLDATHPIEPQAIWMRKVLSTTKKTWKFAIFHFPPFSYEEDYPKIRATWGALFDEFHVDIVLSGHVHYYMRSKPMLDQRPVASPADGTIYIISIAIPNRNQQMPERDYVDVRFGGEMLYQIFDIKNNHLVYRAMNIHGDVRDEFTIEKLGAGHFSL